MRSEILFHMPSATDYPVQDYTDGAHCSYKGKRVTPVPRSKTYNSKSTPKGKAERKKSTFTANPSRPDDPPPPDTPMSSSSQMESADSSFSSSDDDVCSYKARILDLESKLARLKKKAKKIKKSKKLNT